MVNKITMANKDTLATNMVKKSGEYLNEIDFALGDDSLAILQKHSTVKLPVRLIGNKESWGKSPYIYNSNNKKKNSVGEVDLTNVEAISMGAFAGAALKKNGSVVTWGHYKYGGSPWIYNEAGLGRSLNKPYYNYELRRITKQVDLRNCIAISMGAKAGAALKKNGSVVTWGDERFGGDPSIYYSSGSVKSKKKDLERDCIAISMGAYAGAALKKDGSVITWGDSARRWRESNKERKRSK